MAILLKIRLIQIIRELNNAGFGIIILPGIVISLIYASFIVFRRTPDAYYLTIFLFLISFSVHSYRKDSQFVLNHIQNPLSEMYTEYFVLTFPFMVTSLFTSNWFCYPLFLLALAAVPSAKFTIKKKTWFRNISTIIPASDFEWISGFRKSFLFLIPLYLLAIGFSWFRVLPLILLWFITITIASFYIECEPLHILKEGNQTSGQLIKQKLFRHSKYLVILFFPVLLINMIFNPGYLMLSLLFIPMQLSLLCYAICLKYSTYEPDKYPFGNNIIFSLVSLGSIVPYLLPVPFFLAVYTYRKAKFNLNNYLDD